MGKMTIHSKINSMIGTAKPVYFNRVLPVDKKQKELFIAKEFSELQQIKGIPLIEIVNSDDDYAGKPDIFAKLDDKPIGIQLTELKYEHRPKSNNVALSIAEKLLDEILKLSEPEFPVYVDIHSSKDYQNEILTLKKKEIIRLASLISKAIINREFSSSISDFFKNPRPSDLRINPINIPKELNDKIKKITISKIPDGNSTLCPGRRNVFINFRFDIVVTSDVSMESLIADILQKKEKGEASILLVWARDQDFWGEEEEISEIFKRLSEKSSFDYIYIFFFIDAEKLFKPNRKVFMIKEKP